MSNIYIRGDAHGQFDWLPTFCENYNTTKDDILIILGDAGLNFYGEFTAQEQALKEYVTTCPVTLFCIRGNHEARPSSYYTMVKTNSHPIIHCEENGYLYYQPQYNNIYYAEDGMEYTINNKTFLALGGAYSVDALHRVAMGWNWFPDEQLSAEEMCKIEEKCSGKTYDYVLSHTCPYSWQPTWLFMSNIDQNGVDCSMEHWMNQFKDKIYYTKWFFGHYHSNHDYSKIAEIPAMLLFDQVIQI